MLNKLKRLFEVYQKQEVLEIDMFETGFNGDVFRVKTEHETSIIKSYQKSNDADLRLKREIYFLEKVGNLCTQKIPKIKFYDLEQKILCENYIEGIKTGTSSNLINSILNFNIEINNLINYKEYCFLAADNMLYAGSLFMDILNRANNWAGSENNIEALISKISLDILDASAARKDLLQFAKAKWRKLISHSDIGPHNMLFKDEYSFIDFEYAGVDSSIKLGLDLITHPDIDYRHNFNKESEELFSQLMGFDYEEIPKSLIGLFKLKWLFIQINKSRKLGFKLSGSNRNTEDSIIRLRLEEIEELCYKN